MLVDIVASDGMAFFVRKSLFEEGKITFDEQTYGGGFHFYDMDISMQVLTACYRVCVCRDVLVEHKWNGHYAGGIETFLQARDIFFKKWKAYFPIHRGLPDIPEYVFTRMNNLCLKAYDAERARNSKAYKLGKALLHPFDFLKSKL